MSSYHWVANRDITVKNDVKRLEGEYVPEAHVWKDPDHWERAKHIRKVPGPPPEIEAAMPGGDGCIRHDLKDGVCCICGWTEPTTQKPSDTLNVWNAEAEAKSKTGAEEKARAEVAAAAAADRDASQPTTDSAESEAEAQDTLDAPPQEDSEEPDAVESAAATDASQDAGASEDSSGGTDEDPYTKSDLSKMLKADLQAIAEAWGLAVAGCTKAQIVVAILEAQEG